MCYPCTKCGRCGKYDEKSVYYVPPAAIPCLSCGGLVNSETGICDACGKQAFVPTAMMDRGKRRRTSKEVRDGIDVG